MMWTEEKQIFWRYIRISGNCNSSNRKLTQKNFRTSMELDSMASASTLQCSTNWAMATHTLEAGQFVDFILTHEWNKTYNEDDMN